MKLLSRYIFSKMVLALALTLMALSVTIWLSQALREFDLVTSYGQSFGVFLRVSALIFPSLVMIIGPTAMLIAILYTLNTLNNDSELVVINASGASQMVLLKPVLLIGLIMTMIVGAITLELAPGTQRSLRDLITAVNTSLVTSVIREGEFRNLAPGLIFHLNERLSDGSLSGIYVADSREPDQTITYIAKRGTLLDNPLGTFLIMQDGTIQRRQTGSISMVDFQSYAFDLSTFTSTGPEPVIQPTQQPMSFLLNPDPDDPYFQRNPGRIRSELHDRLSSPLYMLVFALVPLALLGQAHTTRSGRGLLITTALIVVVILRGAGFVLSGTAAKADWAIPALYAVPLGGILVSLVIILGNIRVTLPESLSTLADSIGRRFSGRRRQTSARLSGPEADY